MDKKQLDVALDQAFDELVTTKVGTKERIQAVLQIEKLYKLKNEEAELTIEAENNKDKIHIEELRIKSEELLKESELEVRARKDRNDAVSGWRDFLKSICLALLAAGVSVGSILLTMKFEETEVWSAGAKALAMKAFPSLTSFLDK